MLHLASSTSVSLAAWPDALVVVVDGHGERALGLVLADHVVVEDVVDLARLGQIVETEDGRRGELLVDDLVAEIDALVADVHARAGDELLDLPLRLAAEAAEQLVVVVARSCQLPVLLVRCAVCPPQRWAMTSSMMP